MMPRHPIQINGPFAPAEQRHIRLAFERCMVTDKEQAREAGIGIDTVRWAWNHIADRLGLLDGQRRRPQIIIELVRRRHVEYLMLAIALCLGMQSSGDLLRTARNRPTRTTQTVRTGRSGRPEAITIDPETGVVTVENLS